MYIYVSDGTSHMMCIWCRFIINWGYGIQGGLNKNNVYSILFICRCCKFMSCLLYLRQTRFLSIDKTIQSGVFVEENNNNNKYI